MAYGVLSSEGTQGPYCVLTPWDEMVLQCLGQHLDEAATGAPAVHGVGDTLNQPEPFSESAVLQGSQTTQSASQTMSSEIVTDLQQQPCAEVSEGSLDCFMFGVCNPCGFNLRPGGCTRRDACAFCHRNGHRPPKNPSKKRRQLGYRRAIAGR